MSVSPFLDATWTDAPASEAPYAVLLMAYGAPERLEDVEPYLADVRGGRETSPALVAELRSRYAAIGGRSPLREHTEAQAAALAKRLGDGIPVFVGMRHWRPYIRDVLSAMTDQGHRRVVALALAPHYSRLSVGAYARSLEQAVTAPEVVLVPHWFDHPRFLDAVADKAQRAFLRLGASDEPAALVFTAHSLPERIQGEGDPYVEQLQASVAGVAARLGPRPIRFAFQSAGRSDEPWLGPDAASVLEELATSGAGSVVVCPIGFVSDHLEVLYDIDIEYRALAERLGIRLIRTESLNASPIFIDALADIVASCARRHDWIPCA